jgi:hypothetical protein
MCTTFFVEAAIFDRPLIALGFDVREGINYWNSARRFFEWDHMADLGKTGGVTRVKNREELISAVNGCIAHPTNSREGRMKIIQEQAVFTDGHSLSRIVEILKKKSMQ